MSFTTIEQADISRGNIVSNNKNSVIVSNQFLAKFFGLVVKIGIPEEFIHYTDPGFLSDAFLFSKIKSLILGIQLQKY